MILLNVNVIVLLLCLLLLVFCLLLFNSIVVALCVQMQSYNSVHSFIFMWVQNCLHIYLWPMFKDFFSKCVFFSSSYTNTVYSKSSRIFLFYIAIVSSSSFFVLLLFPLLFAFLFLFCSFQFAKEWSPFF